MHANNVTMNQRHLKHFKLLLDVSLIKKKSITIHTFNLIYLISSFRFS